MSLVLQGSTSGSITLQEPAVAGSTVLDLPATSGTILTTGSSGQSIPKAALPTGSVLQVVSTTKIDSFTTTSSSYIDVTGLSVSITPTSASSKILVLVSVSYGSNQDDVLIRIMRDSTAIAQGSSGGSVNGLNQTNGNIPVRFGMQTGSSCHLDSPSTTSSITYKIQIVSVGGSSTACINRRGEGTGYGGSSSITVMEIAA